jgi:TRAP-type uncharacterized transport system substrate-binding protein
MNDRIRGTNRLGPRDRLKRVLGQPRAKGSWSPGTKTAILFGALALLAALVIWLDPRPSLRHVKVTVTSGGKTGNYYANVEKFAAQIGRSKGRVTNIASAGSVENLQRLIDGRKDCKVHFGLVQDGLEFPEDQGLELIGRLPRPESLIIVGRDADRIREAAELRGLRLGIGPVGSGTERLMRRVLRPMEGLGIVVSTQPIDQQLDMIERGDLDLGAMVIDEDADLVADVVTRRGLQILAFPGADSLARRLPFTRVGLIQAGSIDYVRKLPHEDKRVLQVDALIVSNGCAPNGVTQGFLAGISVVFPDFIPRNKVQPNLTGLPMATVATNFFIEDGPDLLGRHAPWAVDIMPLPTWIKLGVAFSLLFSAMAAWHRFNLWRIDAERVKIERELPAVFHPGITVNAIAEMAANAAHLTAPERARLDSLLDRLSALINRCRRQSLSVLVPMGEEMSYRYQETLMADLIDALRLYRDRLDQCEASTERG